MFEKNEINFQIIGQNGDIRAWAKKELDEKAITQRPVTAKTYTKPASSYYENYGASYFSDVKPIFKGANNGLK